MTLSNVLDAAQQLSYEEKNMLVEILKKCQIETRRDEIADNAQEALRTFQAGELKTESATGLISRLHQSLEAGIG